jgi:hypothetical protein
VQLHDQYQRLHHAALSEAQHPFSLDHSRLPGGKRP